MRDPTFQWGRTTSVLFCVTTAGLAFLQAAVSSASASPPNSSGYLDPTRGAGLQAPPANLLSGQFIWTAGDAAALDPVLQARVRGQNDKTAPHYFRAHFLIHTLPREATLYIAGPRSANVYLNGQLVLGDSEGSGTPKNLTVLSADAASSLRLGDNVVAIEAVRGHGSLHTGASPTINQITYGEVLAVKIVPRAKAVDAKPVLVSDTSWRSTLTPSEGWHEPSFNDAQWPLVQTLGVLGSKKDFLQWNADAGLYAWPGYAGIGSKLRVFSLAPASMKGFSGGETIDFGREISGRLRIASNADTPLDIAISYGESREESEKAKSYPGKRNIAVPPHATVFGPKSGFRYVSLSMPHETRDLVRIDAQGITYPVRYLGRFVSSDPTINRIWETAAYTAHLCMQEGIWDGVKRDRGRWMGDLDVTGRTITSVFGERILMEETMTDIAGEPPVTRDINTIVGYSALWITGLADFYRHTGDLVYLRKMQTRLVGLLALLDSELDDDGFFNNRAQHKVFVDWSEGFNADTPEARAATHLEITRAYDEAAYLLQELGDSSEAARSLARAQQMRQAARQHILNDGTFGLRWQTNAMAVLSGAAQSDDLNSIWQRVLSHVAEGGAVITPYYAYYVLSAMAALGHRGEALQWMRSYWGGMLDEGATSFWEAYDPHWPKQDFHAFLEADNKRGYYISLAHGWASGPAPWLMEQVLGIQPKAAGFREVTIRPDLAGLQWARGAEPTPRGLIRVDVRPNALTVVLPPGTRATVQLPFPADSGEVRLNGQPLPSSLRRDAGRVEAILRHAGSYNFSLVSTSVHHHAS